MIITATIEGEKQLSAELLVASDHIKDWRVPLTQTGSDLLKVWQINFEGRGATFGGWKPRKPQVRKGARVDTWPLLEKTGAMRRSFYSKVGKDEVRLGNTAPYFKYHQSNQPRTRLPRRVMMQLDEQQRQVVIKRFQAWIVEGLRGVS